jgi:hypothetical protein
MVDLHLIIKQMKKRLMDGSHIEESRGIHLPMKNKMKIFGYPKAKWLLKM